MTRQKGKIAPLNKRKKGKTALPNSSLSKGNALEDAVRVIESSILRASPSYEENTFLIYNKKIVIVDGVRHEIDIWVEIDLGRGYQSVFIFECKNQEEKVGKNEIIVFSEKIAAVGATRGIFIAKSFTRDARAQAAKNLRVSLLVATEHSAKQSPIPFDFHFISQERTDATLSLDEQGDSSKRQKSPLNIVSAQAKLAGQDLDLNKYVQEWISSSCNDRLRSFQSQMLPEGSYKLEVTSERRYDPGELLVDSMDIESASLKVEFEAHIIRPPVISHFEIETRGRSISLAPIKVSDSGSIQFRFAEIPT